MKMPTRNAISGHIGELNRKEGVNICTFLYSFTYALDWICFTEGDGVDDLENSSLEPNVSGHVGFRGKPVPFSVVFTSDTSVGMENWASERTLSNNDPSLSSAR